MLHKIRYRREVAVIFLLIPVFLSGLFATGTQAASASSALRFSKVILEIDHDSDLLFQVKQSDLSGFSSPRAIFTVNGTETTVSDFTTSGGYCVFTLSNLSPDLLNRPVTARLTASSGGTAYTGDEIQKSAIEFGAPAFDFNEDKDVTILDLIRLKKYFSQGGSVYIASTADPKNDGNRDQADMAALQKYLLIAPSLREINRLPAFPDQVVAEISRTGKQNTWGGYAETVNRVFGPTIGDSVNLSGADQIEFDLYVEDRAAFVSAVSGKTLRFFLASGSTKTQSQAGYDFTDQILQNGWNHIVLKKDSPAGNNGINYASVKWFGLAFSNGSGNNPIGSAEVRIVNLCATHKTVSGSWTEEDDDF